MTNPYTTPTNIPQSTVLPRYPDGSPMPRKVVEQRQAEQAVMATQADEEFIQQAYGQTLEELADEAEKGYNVTPQIDNDSHHSSTVIVGEESGWEMGKETVRGTIHIDPEPQLVEKTPAQKRAETIAKKKAQKLNLSGDPESFTQGGDR